jgi:hypothetical protein
MPAKKATPDQIKKLKESGLFKEYRKTATVLARKMDKPFICDTLEGDNIRGKKGDYLLIAVDTGEQWPVDGAIFEKTYEAI